MRNNRGSTTTELARFPKVIKWNKNTMKTMDICALIRAEDFMMLDVPVQTFIDEDGQVVFNADDVEKALGLEAGEMQEILQHINS